MKAHDEVCGMTIETDRAAATTEFQGKTYYFCTERCREKFEEHPGWYVPVTGDPADTTNGRGSDLNVGKDEEVPSAGTEEDTR